MITAYNDYNGRPLADVACLVIINYPERQRSMG